MSVSELGAWLYLEKSTASRLAKALLKKDLIRRRAPKGDTRVVILQVTEAGQRLTRRILNDLAEEYMDLLGEFTPEVREALPTVLDRLSRVIAARTHGSDITCC
jgi:DNA-binding MarR family transcriptional regulator